jgi:signal transduction histidine kinase
VPPTDNPPRDPRTWFGIVARAWPLYVALTLLPVVGLAAYATLGWTTRPFPGFFLMQNAVVPTVSRDDWTGVTSGLPYHAQIIAVDGHPVITGSDVYEHVAALPVGTPIAYRYHKDGEPRRIVVPSMEFDVADYWLVIGVLLAFGVMAIGTGLFVVTVQPTHEAARVFFLMLLAVGLFGLSGPMLYAPALSWCSPFHFLMQAIFPATFIHFGLVFPRPRPFIERHRLLLGIPYLVGILMTLWILATFYNTPPDTTALYAAYAYSGLAIVVLVGLHSEALWRYRDGPEARQVRPILLPIAVGMGVACFGFLNTARSGGDFPINYIAVTPIVYFLAIGYSILRHGLFDADIVVRRLASLNRELADEIERRTSELQAAQTQVMHSEKLASLGRLVAGVAHEINNPVSFIAGNAQNLGEALAAIKERTAGSSDPALARQIERLEKMCGIIVSGAERTAGIVNDLRYFSRVGEPAPVEVDVQESLDVVLRLLRPRLGGSITVHHDYEPLPSIRAVPGQLNQVFMNVVHNACDALPNGGNIWLRALRRGTEVVISIRDDGVGIAPDHLRHVFEPFFTTKPQQEGTGLGLSISHGIVSAHGGRLEVRSPAPGATVERPGTEFSIVLPIADGRMTTGETLQEGQSTATGTGRSHR